MIESELWEEYLHIINISSQAPTCYGMDQKRSEIHDELFNHYKELLPDAIRQRFDDICHNLDKIIDFNPPLERYDSINFYVHAMDQYMWGHGKLYLTGKIDKL